MAVDPPPASVARAPLHRAPLHRTPLHHEHDAAGAKLAPFAGWQMPVRFSGEVAEHTAVRDGVGVFDVSHLGTVWVTGPAATETLGRSFTADAAAIADGGSRYALCLTEDGGILDDLIVYRFSGQRWLAVPNAANTAAVLDRLRTVAAQVRADADDAVAAAAAADDPQPARLAVGTTKIDDASVGWATLAVQGPETLATLRAALDLDASGLAFTEVAELPVGSGGPTSLSDLHLPVARTGYTGEVGVELLVPAEHAVAVWRALLTAGAVPCGLGARDTLRLEMGYPLHGNDLDVDVRPAEGRVGWAVQATTADGARRRFVGSDAVAAEPGQRRLVGLRSAGRRPLRAGLEVRRGDELVGHTTSGGYAPTLGRGIALARLDARADPGERLTVDVRGTAHEVEIVRPPFVDRDPRG